MPSNYPDRISLFSFNLSHSFFRISRDGCLSVISLVGGKKPKVIISSWLDFLEREPQTILLPLILLVVRALLHLLPLFSRKNPHTDLSKGKSVYFIKWPCASRE